MKILILLLMLMANHSELPPDTWACTNQIEVWCTVDSCAAKDADEMTPLRISARRDGVFSVCAYTGCWEGKASLTDNNGRLLWAADQAAFSSRPEGGLEADISLMIVEKDGVGFVRVGGIATPLLCLRAEPLLELQE